MTQLQVQVVPASRSEAAPQGSHPELQALTPYWHVASCAAKGEDISVVDKTFSSGDAALYAVGDGHNGKQAATAVAALLPGELGRQLGGGMSPGPETVRAALARSFVAIDDAICHQFMQSGCTLTAAVHSQGDILTVGSVGDSRAFLDTGAEVVELTIDHRIGCSPAEMSRLEAAGGHLARLNEYGAGPSRGVHDGVGPVRLWPGGIMVGRAVGDRDVGSILLPHPHIRQVKLPPTGARLIVASDGLWDAMPAGRVARVLRSQPTAKGAAMQAVTGVAASLGGLLRDDVTVVVVDFLPHGCVDFRRVVAQFQGRLRTVLSNPQLSSLELQCGTVQEEEPVAPAPRRGLFACLSKPAVVDPECSHNGSVRSGRGNHSAHSTSSLGGSEKSVRSGVVRDPSVRGCKRATTVELLYDGDSAKWTPSELGRAPSLCSPRCGRTSFGSVNRSSPRSLCEGMYGGHSMASFSSEEDYLESPQQAGLARGISLPAALEPVRRIGLSRKQSAAPKNEKKCHGSCAAAELLQGHPIA